MKEETIEERKWEIELTESQLQSISEALEFTSRFHCGQTQHHFLPLPTQDLLWDRDDWEESQRRRTQYDLLASLMTSIIHPKLDPGNGHSYGIGFSNFSDDLYDIYKLINHTLYKERNSDDDEFYRHSVNAHRTKFGTEPDIKIKKIKL